MAQHDYNIANQTGLEFRADLNNALQAIVTDNSGATEPAITFPGMVWRDTSVSPSILKKRSDDNTTWVIVQTPVGEGVMGASSASVARAAISAQEVLVSGSSIKTVNGQSILGSGNLSAGYDTFRNKIINGDFRINQRAYVSGAATSAGQYTLDRWKVTGTGGITFSTVNNKTTVTIPSGQTLQQVIEGLNLQTGTYVLSWEGTAQGRIGGGAYGASGTVTAAITGGANTTIEFNAGTVANVQLEVGSVATPFEHRPYGTELALCQRYYEIILVSAGQYNAAAGNTACVSVPFKVSKRATPTVATVGAAVISSNVSSASFDSISTEGARYVLSAAGSGVSAGTVNAAAAIEL